MERIGQGQCAEVYRARWRGTVAVAKVLKRAGDYKAGWTLETARADLVHEISVLSHLRHPNLVLFLGASMDKNNVVLLNEYIDGGNLEEYVAALNVRHPGSRSRIPSKQCARWGIDLSQALTFLHGCNPSVIHRDLKPANLLLCSMGCLKVGDFGLSSARPRNMNGGAYVMTGRTGTIRYMAPEAMNLDKDGNSTYNEKVDCYSAAMVMWYMCMADKPFGDLDADLIMAGAASGLRPDLTSIQRRHGKHMAETIKSCWEEDPIKRSTAEELLDKMREQLSIIEKKKSMRRRLTTMPVASIYKWARSASSAASKMFGRGDRPQPDLSDDKRNHPLPHDAEASPRSSGELESHPDHHPTWLLPKDSSGLDSTTGSRLDSTTGSYLDNTNTSTGTWSFDTSSNTFGGSLDNTANTTTSKRSAGDDWFMQVADERRRDAAASADGTAAGARDDGVAANSGATSGTPPLSATPVSTFEKETSATSSLEKEI